MHVKVMYIIMLNLVFTITLRMNSAKVIKSLIHILMISPAAVMSNSACISENMKGIAEINGTIPGQTVTIAPPLVLKYLCQSCPF